MEELNLIIQDFEETCSTLAITHDSPCQEYIKEKFEEYHERKLKLSGIANVSQQRELLLAFLEFYHNPKYKTVNTTFSEDVDLFFANNCA